MFLARLLAHWVVVNDGDGEGEGEGGGFGRDIFRFLYIARDKPRDKQNATTATRACRGRVRFPPAASKPRVRKDCRGADANGNQIEERENHAMMRHLEFDRQSAVSTRTDQ